MWAGLRGHRDEAEVHIPTIIANAMRLITRTAVTIIGTLVGGFFGFAFTLALACAACDSAGFLPDHICTDMPAWGSMLIASPTIAGLVVGGILGYFLGGKSALWVMGSQKQTISKIHPAVSRGDNT